MDKEDKVILAVSAEDVMNYLGLPVCMEVGMLVAAAQNAVRANKIHNDFAPVLEYIESLAVKMKIIKKT